MSQIETYKEPGAYERHLNQMQNVYRTLASTWLLATFGGIGYVFKNDVTAAAIDVRIGGSLVALAGGTGIFLLWLLDVMVYHKLLVAVANEAALIEQASDLPKLRRAMAEAAESRVGSVRLSARRKISLFYGLPTVFLWSLAFILHVNAASAEGTAMAVGLWL